VLERSGPIESNRVVALFNRVMNWTVDEDRAKFNPAARLKKVGQKRRERVLTNDEMKRLWMELNRPLNVDRDKGGLTDADLSAAIAIRHAVKLLVLTGQRRGEVIGMAKKELDLSEDNSWWTIPGRNAAAIDRDDPSWQCRSDRGAQALAGRARDGARCTMTAR
jgi:integrase